MDAEPIVFFCRKSLFLREVEAILLAPPANDPPVNPKGDDVSLNAIKEGNYSASLHSVFSISLVV